ncbi:helix-turn-helix domain-containing protein, partial [Streptomyces sp. G1]|nr:helix-turn-helix domain-containing protein [Streptomyces sp. G1]
MGGWQPLPDDLPPEVRHFVTQLRLLKDRTGLSLVALGARTAYSKSSWERS